MTVNLSPLAGAAAQFFDNSGVILSGGKIYTYAAGTTTPQAVYTSSAGTTPHSNPIVLDSAGRVPGGEIWLTDGLFYKFTLETSTAILLGTYDNLEGINVSVAAANVALTPSGYTTATNVQTGFDNLGSSAGTSKVGFIQGGTGAVSRTAQAKMRDTVNVKDFGAVGDGVTDDTLAIQAAINYLSPFGGTLYIPKGAYIVSDADADNACLVITAPIQVLGDGPFYTSIQPAASVGGAVNTILVYPNINFDQTLMSFRNLSLGFLNTGTRQGNHGIYCVTILAGQNLPKFTVENCVIAQGGGYAIRHLNDPAANVNGAMYGAYFNNNVLKGGISLENSGDSIAISNNIISGVGTGVSAYLTSGASLLSIIDNNITTTNSAIIIQSGARVHILRNNIEHYTPGANSNAVIDIIATGYTYVAGVIQQNLISAFGASDATTLIFLRNARGTLIQDNVIISGIAALIGTTINATCNDVRIGPNTYNVNIATKVSDFGVGTMGVVKTATLQNGWVAYGAGTTPTFYKDVSGVVHINGSIKSGTAVFGTTLFALPVGFRPSVETLFASFANNGVSNVPAYFGIDTSGLVFFGQGGGTLMTTEGGFVPSNAGDSVTPE